MMLQARTYRQAQHSLKYKRELPKFKAYFQDHLYTSTLNSYELTLQKFTCFWSKCQGTQNFDFCNWHISSTKAACVSNPCHLTDCRILAVYRNGGFCFLLVLCSLELVAGCGILHVFDICNVTACVGNRCENISN